MNICIFGASSNDIAGIYFDEVYHLGELMAEKGYRLVYGGGQTGLMGAAVRGLKNKGGYAIGISPAFFDDGVLLYKGNDELIYTRDLSDRKVKMLEMSDAFIAVPGGIGTYDELFEAFVENQIGTFDKPLILLNTDGFYTKLWEFIMEARDKGFIYGGTEKCCHLANTPEEALEIIKEFVNI